MVVPGYEVVVLDVEVEEVDNDVEEVDDDVESLSVVVVETLASLPPAAVYSLHHSGVQ